jgi:hypothetical protein
MRCLVLVLLLAFCLLLLPSVAAGAAACGCTACGCAACCPAVVLRGAAVLRVGLCVAAFCCVLLLCRVALRCCLLLCWAWAVVFGIGLLVVELRGASDDVGAVDVVAVACFFLIFFLSFFYLLSSRLASLLCTVKLSVGWRSKGGQRCLLVSGSEILISRTSVGDLDCSCSWEALGEALGDVPAPIDASVWAPDGVISVCCSGSLFPSISASPHSRVLLIVFVVD